MKWFKHDCNAGEDKKLRVLQARYGIGGYGVYFRTLELIGEEIGESRPLEEWGILPSYIGIEDLAKILGVPAERLREMYDCMALAELIDPEAWSGGVIACPKIIERSDDYIQKILRTKRIPSEVSPDSVRSKSGKKRIPSEVSPDSVRHIEIDIDPRDKKEDHGQGEGVPPSSPPIGGDPLRVPFAKILELYHFYCPGLPHAEMTDSRKAKIRVRWGEHSDIGWWEKVFRTTQATPFLLGENRRGWRASLDWLVANDCNAVKVLEGRYSGTEAAGGPTDAAPRHRKPDPLEEFEAMRGAS